MVNWSYRTTKSLLYCYSSSGGSRICGRGTDHGEQGAQSYNGGPGMEPLVCPGAKPLVGFKGQSPRKLKVFVHFHTSEGPKVKDLNEMI